MAATTRLLSTLRLLTIAVIACSVPVASAFAQGHRAQVSKDVEQQLKRGGPEMASVIVPVTGAEADALAARHNGRQLNPFDAAALVLDAVPILA